MSSLRVTGVCERDVDLLLLEEFVASPGLLEWFLPKIELPPGMTLVSAERSITRSTGESDLELTLATESRITKVLIENKVDAVFQPRQAERYRERAARYVQAGVCTSAVTVLFAPEAYYSNAANGFAFDRPLSYESLLHWFEDSRHLGDRGSYKQALIRGAIDRSQAGWRLVPHEAVTEFWRSYWEPANALAPELRMPKPSAKPKTSGFVTFRPTVLPRGVSLIHKMPYGNVDIQFAGKGKHLPEMHALYGHQLEAGMQLERAAKSAVVRVCVEPVDMAAPFPASEHTVRSSLHVALNLLRLYKNVFRPSGAQDQTEEAGAEPECGRQRGADHVHSGVGRAQFGEPLRGAHHPGAPSPARSELDDGAPELQRLPSAQ
jgi:hypothetical protein